MSVLVNLKDSMADFADVLHLMLHLSTSETTITGRDVAVIRDRLHLIHDGMSADLEQVGRELTQHAEAPA